MAVAARQLENDYAYMPATRVYSKAAAVRAKREEEEARQDMQLRAQRKAWVKAAGRETLRKLSMLLTVGVAMASILFMLARYSQINHAYAEVNQLRNAIDSVKLEINGLNVQLNSAVSLQEAREAAQEAGLGYPKGEQIVTVRAYAQGAPQGEASEIEVLD